MIPLSKAFCSGSGSQAAHSSRAQSLQTKEAEVKWPMFGSFLPVPSSSGPSEDISSGI